MVRLNDAQRIEEAVTWPCIPDTSQRLLVLTHRTWSARLAREQVQGSNTRTDPLSHTVRKIFPTICCLPKESQLANNDQVPLRH
jgi:hypothetical protein